MELGIGFCLPHISENRLLGEACIEPITRGDSQMCGVIPARGIASEIFDTAVAVCLGHNVSYVGHMFDSHLIYFFESGRISDL